MYVRNFSSIGRTSLDTIMKSTPYLDRLWIAHNSVRASAVRFEELCKKIDKNPGMFDEFKMRLR